MRYDGKRISKKIGTYMYKRNSGRIPSLSTRFSLIIEMSRLTRDGTAKPPRDTKFSGANGDMETFIFPDQLTTRRIGNRTRLILTLAIRVTITREETLAIYVTITLEEPHNM